MSIQQTGSDVADSLVQRMVDKRVDEKVEEIQKRLLRFSAIIGVLLGFFGWVTYENIVRDLKGVTKQSAIDQSRAAIDDHLRESRVQLESLHQDADSVRVWTRSLQQLTDYGRRDLAELQEEIEGIRSKTAALSELEKQLAQASSSLSRTIVNNPALWNELARVTGTTRPVRSGAGLQCALNQTLVQLDKEREISICVAEPALDSIQ